MHIKNIFSKDIFRPINGVIKVNDESAAAVWQELDEYVVTNELHKHFLKFFGVYLEAVDNPKNSDVRNRIGVWVSGFFGSGILFVGSGVGFVGSGKIFACSG